MYVCLHGGDAKYAGAYTRLLMLMLLWDLLAHDRRTAAVRDVGDRKLKAVNRPPDVCYCTRACWHMPLQQCLHPALGLGMCLHLHPSLKAHRSSRNTPESA